MKGLIEKILEKIKNYRIEDVGLTFNKIDYNHIERWINQFNEADRKFVLSELLHILPQSYLSKENTLRILGEEFEIFRKDFGYETVPDFLNETKILDCQEDQKSQKVLLSFVKELLFKKYGYDIGNCGCSGVKNWLYIDDVLASGKTFKDDILDEIEKFDKEKFKKSDINIISAFVILHSWGVKNVRFSIDTKLDYKLEGRLKFYRVSKIDNNPHIHSYFNSDPKFNHVYPLKSQIGTDFLDFIENAFVRNYKMSNEKFAFRDSLYPKNETFYSSKQNRIRYENIILEKGIEIINSIDTLRAQSVRPLGITPPGNKTLGTGSHFFTWRNISNTCPLVFWWGTNDWYPLFPVKNRGN
jgi:hypothetical protein